MGQGADKNSKNKSVPMAPMGHDHDLLNIVIKLFLFLEKLLFKKNYIINIIINIIEKLLLLKNYF